MSATLLLDLEIQYAAARQRVNAGRRRMAQLRARIDGIVADHGAGVRTAGRRPPRALRTTGGRHAAR